ncbi:HAMP domain-containing sensor histidine kinase [Chryseobacterium sp. MA9]|uniref:sensor histidine kinase n=1 Tax=Chryseobacterium sp. MA9 TaxID=2966625 RepID=UPI0021021603|nr:HAMP domain-containing sensor histidine kinase [Chryseobacterium sp. MA9]UTX46680.1 HAMP domain-containing histidine kinase [Chryseobacterium sp. MA9]
MKLLYFISLLFFLCVNGQSYTSQWYNMDNGLPQNSIKDIVKDKYGFIWLSMEGRIVRYDGSNFVQYRNFKFKNLSFGDFFGNIQKDSITIFNASEKNVLLISQRKPHAISSNQVFKPGGTGNQKVYKQLVKNNITVRFISYIDSYFIRLSAGAYYFENNGIIYIDKKSKKNTKIDVRFPHHKLKRLFVHGDYGFIADTENKKIFQLYQGKYSYISAPSVYTDPETKIYWQQITGQVFLINHGKIYRSEFSEGKFKLTYLLEYRDIGKEISGAMFYDDATHKLYIGSSINGLKILSLSDFSVSRKNLPYQDEVCYAAVPYGDHSVLTQEGIKYSQGSSERIYPARQSYDKRYMLEDNFQNLVYRENNSIHIRNKNSGFIKYDSISFEEKEIHGLYKSGGLYMASLVSGQQSYLYLFKHDHFKEIEKIIPCKDNIDAVLRYNKDLLYLGGGGGIYVFSLSRNKVVKLIGKGLPVKQIIKTKDGNIWFTTYSRGIYLIRDQKAIKIPSDKNDFLANAHYLLEDQNSNLWISSDNGLFKVNKNTLLQYIKAPKEVLTYYRYTKKHGLLNNEFNGSANPCAHELKNGEFVFPSMGGFVFFTPENVKTYYPKSESIYLERAKVNGKMIQLTDKLLLECGYKNAELYIDIPYYSDLENIYLQAKLLDNEGSSWVNIKSDKTFRLANMEPGNYTLLVRFLSSETGKFVYKTIPVDVEAYFYQTFLFKILIAGIAVFIVLVIVQMRTNFLRLKNKVLKNTLVHKDKELLETSNKLKNESDYQKKLVESISHDITTPVKFIALLSQELNQSVDLKTQKKYFDSIYKTSEQLYKFTLSLKEYTELYKQGNITDEEYSVYDLIETKRLLFEEIAARENTFIYNFCDHQLKTRLNKNILLAVFHNIIDNAVKNTSDGKITITSASTESHIEISITDTGSGMSDEQRIYYSELFKKKGSEHMTFKNYGLGLHMVAQLMMKINSEMTFYKNTPKGTIIKILIKI